MSWLCLLARLNKYRAALREIEKIEHSYRAARLASEALR
jgi:hypothetical protein